MLTLSSPVASLRNEAAVRNLAAASATVVCRKASRDTRLAFATPWLATGSAPQPQPFRCCGSCRGRLLPLFHTAASCPLGDDDATCVQPSDYEEYKKRQVHLVAHLALAPTPQHVSHKVFLCHQAQEWEDANTKKRKTRKKRNAKKGKAKRKQRKPRLAPPNVSRRPASSSCWHASDHTRAFYRHAAWGRSHRGLYLWQQTGRRRHRAHHLHFTARDLSLVSPLITGAAACQPLTLDLCHHLQGTTFSRRQRRR